MDYNQRKYVKILPKTAINRCFDYLVPNGTELEIGDIVKISLGRKTELGVVWEFAENSEVKNVKEVSEKADFPALSPQLIEFIEKTARYNLAPIGAVFSMLFPGFKTPKKIKEEKTYEKEKIDLSDEQKTAVDAIALDGFNVTLIDGITGSGKTEVYLSAIEKVLEGEGSNPSEPSASEAASHGNFRKNSRGHSNTQALIMLPEIALTSQLVSRIRARFGYDAVIWHSTLSLLERSRNYLKIINGEAKIVIGARSALYLPYKNLGIIVVDEEHDASYKQEDGVIYQARDMAVLRASIEKTPVLLVSATPSVETVANVEAGKYKKVHLISRYGEATLPEIKVVDMRLDKISSEHFISGELRKAIEETVKNGEQVLLYLNRRGYAPLTLCRGCGHRYKCPNCSAWLVEHKLKKKQAVIASERSERDDPEETGLLRYTRNDNLGYASDRSRSPALSASETSLPIADLEKSAGEIKKPLSLLQCHHCGYRTKTGNNCPECQAEDSNIAVGPGVERIAEEIAVVFPELRMLELSSDTVETVAKLDAAIEKIRNGEVDVIIGTQMIAKGHHFPKLTLVGVIDADLGLEGADMRAAERTYQVLHQVAGRAGREKLAGKVLLQSYQPENLVIRNLQENSREKFISNEILTRKNFNLPPFGRLAGIIISGKNEEAVKSFCRKLGSSIPQHPNIKVLGPAPAPITLLRGRFRYRFLVKSSKDMNIQGFIKKWLENNEIPSSLRLKTDIDPYSFN